MSKRTAYAHIATLAAQMAQAFAPPGTQQNAFNSIVLDSAQGNLYNELAKEQAKKENEKGGLLGGLTGAIKGGVTGFATGGPVGAAIGAGAGGFSGATGPKMSSGQTVATLASAFPQKAQPLEEFDAGLKTADQYTALTQMSPVQAPAVAPKKHPFLRSVGAGLAAASAVPIYSLPDGTRIYGD